jgi:hypothetical protein
MAYPGNVARSSPDEVDGTTRINKFFSDEQIDMLVQNTQQMGAGIVMIGGDRAFGAGDWADTELEKAMPVDFTIRNAKIRGVGALVMLMHACELPELRHCFDQLLAEQRPPLVFGQTQRRAAPTGDRAAGR